jgi:precorrin-4 methylase
MPRRRLGEEAVQLLLFLSLGTINVWVDSVTPRPRFTPGERAPPVPTVQEAGWAPEPVWMQRLEDIDQYTAYEKSQRGFLFHIVLVLLG